MDQNIAFKGYLSFDHFSSRILKYWIDLELLLTLVSVILIFFLPKTAAGPFIVVLSAIFITVCAGTFLYYCYNRLEGVKNKGILLTESRKLNTKLTKRLYKEEKNDTQ